MKKKISYYLPIVFVLLIVIGIWMTEEEPALALIVTGMIGIGTYAVYKILEL